MASLTNKKFKRNYIESDSSSDNEAKSTFPRFIIIESSGLPITNLSPFLIEKVISSNLTPISVKKKMKNGTLLVEVEKKKHADFLLKMAMFDNIPVKSYPHKSLKISKGAIRSKELALCTIEKIKKELKKQGVIDVRRISIKRKANQCDQKDPDHHMNECEFPNKSANCSGDHRVYARSCESWRREKEILSIRYKNNIPHYEARKLVVESNIITYSQTVQEGKKTT